MLWSSLRSISVLAAIRSLIFLRSSAAKVGSLLMTMLRAYRPADCTLFFISLNCLVCTMR